MYVLNALSPAHVLGFIKLRAYMSLELDRHKLQFERGSVTACYMVIFAIDVLETA